jgi:hypothetical protein
MCRRSIKLETPDNAMVTTGIVLALKQCIVVCIKNVFPQPPNPSMYVITASPLDERLIMVSEIMVCLLFCLLEISKNLSLGSMIFASSSAFEGCYNNFM